MSLQFPPYVRSSETSYEAAVSMLNSADTIRSKVYRYIRSQGSLGATTEEIELSLRGKHQTISARVNELAKAGLIKPSGKRANTSGRRADVYMVWGV